MSPTDKSVKIALTMGDPAGVGPEILVKVLNSPYFRDQAQFIVYGSSSIMEAAREKFAPDLKLEICECSSLKFSDIKIKQPQASCGKSAYDSVVQATLDAIENKVDAIVTAPMNKYAVNLCNIKFTGHTELIAELCGNMPFAMMQSAGNLRVAFVTTHIPLSQVPDAVTAERIIEVAKLLNEAIQSENIACPKLAAAALNPHAGENGCMGQEDELIVKPSLKLLNEQHINIAGPFPPDTLFIPQTLNKFDGILSMYHDQGHIPFKMLAFDRGVNSTIGLPIIRTSVDHGTAFDIAWDNVADCGSMSAALSLAIIRAKNRKQQQV